MNTEEVEFFLTQIREILDKDRVAEYKLNNIILNATVIRSYQLVRQYLERSGPFVYGGPFQGMVLPPQIVTPYLLSRYMGAYEHELHDAVRESAARAYDTVINIGCAEGYYSVGLARLLPQAQVHAFDILPDARAKCAALAAANGVQDRISVGELFSITDFAAFAGKRALLFCDIEGAEFALLDPTQAPALRDMDIIVEIHERQPDRDPDAFCARFAATHDIVRIGHARGYHGPLPEWLTNGLETNTYLASLCFRESPTPWAWMRSRSLPSPS
ncbi:hypothetical protein M2352_001132 [Azospirillum fermentarium]|uniref:hypothetical protein n=1 Tax=Azospirillum fermentarium TaxID=1233114 RepID=UPI002225F023|nr:hypothetical protein [Azospirillum fermentarium]MCW2245541.1 hypothetical protein [Azospirillum fermentarium]